MHKFVIASCQNQKNDNNNSNSHQVRLSVQPQSPFNVSCVIPSLRPSLGWRGWLLSHPQHCKVLYMSEPILVNPDKYSRDGRGRQGRYTMKVIAGNGAVYNNNPIIFLDDYDFAISSQWRLQFNTFVNDEHKSTVKQMFDEYDVKRFLQII